MAKLVLVRHGESIANAENVYTGWNDVALSEKGILQARKAGEVISKLKDFSPTHIHTSVLSRAIITANIIAEVGNFLWLPITKTWRLNERHYGALRGINKEESKQIFGVEQVRDWRRGFDSVPPKLENNLPDRRYQYLDSNLIPKAESLHQTQRRLMPYFEDQIAPKLRDGQDQLIVAHGSSLRALIKKLENIDNHEILNLEVPNAQPIVYDFDKGLNIKSKKIFS